MKATIAVASAWMIFLSATAHADEPDAPKGLPPITTSDYDTQGRFRVNGKPFFPILLYDAPTDDKTLAELRDFGFNTLTCKPEASVALPAQGFYAAVHSAKPVADPSGIFLMLGMDSPALNYRKDVLAQTKASNAKVAALVPGRPIGNAIGYWENEPKGVVDGVLPSTANYEDLVGVIDVAAPYLYPVPYQPVASVGDAVARARLGTKGTKPILPILQIFAWEKEARYPTVAELRCMTYLALVEGASGIGYYSYGHVTGRPKQSIAEVEPELWRSLKQLNREIAEIGPALFAGNEKPSISLASESVAVKLKAAGPHTGLLAVAVNSATTEQIAKLECHLGAAGTLILDDGRSIEVRNGTATVVLKPFEVVTVRRFVGR